MVTQFVRPDFGKNLAQAATVAALPVAGTAVVSAKVAILGALASNPVTLPLAAVGGTGLLVVGGYKLLKKMGE